MATTAVPFGVGNNPLSAAMGDLSASIGKLQQVSATAQSSIDALTGAISSHIARFVGLYSPVEVIKLSLAVNDLNASIGRALVPVLQKFTLVVREIANVIASLTPGGTRIVGILAAVGVGLATATVATGVFFGIVSGALVGLTVLAGAFGTATAIATAGLSLVFGAIAGIVTTALTGAAAVGFVGNEMGVVQRAIKEVGRLAREAFAAVGNAFDQVMVALKPLTDALGELALQSLDQFTVAVVVMADALTLAFDLMKPQIMTTVAAIKFMTGALQSLVNFVRDFLGIVRPDANPESHLAVRNVRFSSVEDAWREAAKNAFSMGEGAKRDPATESANHLLEILKMLQKWEREFVNGVKVRFAEGAAAVARQGMSPAAQALLMAQRQLYD